MHISHTLLVGPTGCGRCKVPCNHDLPLTEDDDDVVIEPDCDGYL